MKKILIILSLIINNCLGQTFPAIEDNGTEIWLNDSEFGHFLHTNVKVTNGNVFTGPSFYGIGMQIYASPALDSLDLPYASQTEYRFLAVEVLGGTQLEFEDNVACMWEYQYGELIEGKYIVFKFKLYDANDNLSGFVLTTEPIKIKSH